MNFMDLYLDSCNKIDYGDESNRILEIYTPENIQIYQEANMCILEARNFLDLYACGYYDIKLYSEGILAGFIGFMKTAIALWIKIFIALGPTIIAVGLALMSVIFVIKSVGKSGSINSGGGGGGGSYSSSTLRSAKSLTESEFLYSKVDGKKNEKATNIIRDTDGYSNAINRLVKIVEANKGESDAKKRLIMSNIIVGVDKYNDGALALTTEHTFLLKAIKKYLADNVTLENKPFKEIIDKQPFRTILGVAEMNKGLEKTGLDWSKAKMLKPFTAFSADCLVNCDKFMTASIMSQCITTYTLATNNGEDEKKAESDIERKVEEMLNRLSEGLPKTMVNKLLNVMSKSEDLAKEFQTGKINLDEFFTGFLYGCKFQFDTVRKYIQVSKLYSQLKAGDITNIKMDIHEIASSDDCRFLDIIYKDSEHKFLARELVEAIHEALHENGFKDGTMLRDKIKILEDESKKIKDVFDKMKDENFKDISIRDFCKTTQEFAIDILGMLQSIINIAPTLYYNCKSTLYGVIKVDIMRLISAMWDDAFDKFNENK